MTTSYANQYPWLNAPLSHLQDRYQQGVLAHAYIVSGRRGLGKVKLIRDFAAALCCDKPVNGAPCGQCKSCELTKQDSHPDVTSLVPKEPGKGLTVDQIRALSSFVNRSSHAGGSRVAILSEAHTLNSSAANALLKTLEEPHESTFLFLVTDQPGHLSATIRSRCQKLPIATPSEQEALLWMSETSGENFNEKLARECLIVSHGAPLLALDYMNSGDLALRTAIDTTLIDVLLGRKQAEDLFAKLCALDATLAAEQLVMATINVSKALLTDNDESITYPEHYNPIKQLIDAGEEGAKKRAFYGSRALKLYEEAETARRQLSSASNPNPRLILQSLAWLSSRAFRV